MGVLSAQDRFQVMCTSLEKFKVAVVNQFEADLAHFRHLREDNEQLKRDRAQLHESFEEEKTKHAATLTKLDAALSKLDSCEKAKRTAISDLKKFVEENTQLQTNMQLSSQTLADKYAKKAKRPQS